MNTPTLKTLKACHPHYKGRLYRELAALYSGGEDFHEMREDWVPQNHAENPGTYEDRLKRLLYTNHAGPIVDLMASWLFESGIQLGNEPPDKVRTLEKDADGKGTPLTGVMSQVFTGALKFRTAFVWVNMPRNVAKNRLEEDAAGLQPFLVPIEASSVTSWENDDQGRMSWIKLYDVVTRQPDPLAEREKVHRWTVIDRERIRRWEYVDGGKGLPGKDDAALVLDVEHRFGTIPVARLTLPDGLWAMNKLRDPALAALRLENDLRWALHKSAHSLMVIQEGDGFAERDTAPTVGDGYMISLASDAKLYYAEPSGTSHAAIRQVWLDAVASVYQVVHQMALAKGSQGDMSGASKRRDWEALSVIMSAYHVLARDFLQEVLRLVSIATGDAYEPAINGMNSWRKKTLEQLVEASVMTVGAQSMSPTLARELAKILSSLLLSESVTQDKMDQIFEEIDSSDSLEVSLSQMGKHLGDDVFKETGAKERLTADAEADRDAKSTDQTEDSRGISGRV